MNTSKDKPRFVEILNSKLAGIGVPRFLRSIKINHKIQKDDPTKASIPCPCCGRHAAQVVVVPGNLGTANITGIIVWKCYRCGCRGDAVMLAMLVWNHDLQTTIRRLAKPLRVDVSRLDLQPPAILNHEPSPAELRAQKAAEDEEAQGPDPAI